jgi:hypothetical protein
MFKIELNNQGRAAITVNIHKSEIEQINERLATIQSFHRLDASTGRELFMSMIAILEKQALSGISPEATAPAPAASSENMIEMAEFESALFERTKELSEKFDALLETSIKFEAENTAKTDEIESLKSTLSLYENMEIPETIEVEKTIPLGDNDVLLNLEKNQVLVIREIAKNRARKLRLAEVPAIDQIIKEMVFNRGALFNWHEEYWTGLTKKSKQLM